MDLKPYQIEKLIQIVQDFHWMARRYADGRMSYAPSLFNDHVRALQQMGIDLNPTGDKTIWAHDAMGPAYDGMTENERIIEEKEAAKITEITGEIREELNKRRAEIQAEEDRGARLAQDIQGKLMGW